MKRVFEGIVFERRRIGDNAIGACTTEAFEEFYQSLPIGKATRITAEDLSESKSPSADKPETCASCKHDCKREEACECYTPKTCVNCGKYLTSFEDGCAGSCYDSCPNWQPKPAEPKIEEHIIPSDCVKHTCIKQQENGGSMPEPQEWEQRFDEKFGRVFVDAATSPLPNKFWERTEQLKSFIRAEIERVHAGYAPLISAIEMAFKEADFLPDGRLTRQARTVFEPIRKAERNRRGEGGE